MRRFFLAFIALAAFILPAFAQAKHPFTFEDMMKLSRVGEPEVSPDGKWVIFSVVNVDLEANTKTPHIWIVPTAGGQERDIIPDRDADRPRWAPDGKHFAFLSTREGKSQVFSADFDGTTGKATQVQALTSIATEAGGELWSPDGKNILFTSDVYPECDGAPAEEAACNARKLQEVEASKVKAQIFDHLLYRHWNAYKEGERSHLFITPATPPKAGGSSDFKLPVHFPAPRDLTPGDYDAPVFSVGGQDNYAFSPDGQEVCYTSNHDKNPAASTNNDLWIVPVNAGTGHVGAAASAAQDWAQTKDITADNPASDSTPLYSPDGKYIAYRAQQRQGYESDRFRLMLYDRKTGEKRDLTDKLDSWVGTYVWSPDSKRIYFAHQWQDESPVESFAIDRPLDQTVTVDSDAKETARYNAAVVVRDGYNDDQALTLDGKIIVFTRMSISFPTAIYKTNSESSVTDQLTHPPAVLTHLNDTVLSQVAMSPLESFWFKGAHDDKVQGFLVKPPNFDPNKKYPLKFLIHGGPEGAWGDDWSYRWNAELFAAPTSATPSGYVVIMINFHGSTGYGQKFIDAINGDWGGAPFEDLMKGLDYAEEHYAFIDKDRECALGASYGGYMANWILGHTDRFKCIVSHDGTFNAESAWGTTEELWFNDWEFKGTPYDNRAMYEKWSPHMYAKNFKTPTLVIHGQRDYRLDVSEGLQLFTTLQMEGVPSKMLYFPDEGHWVLKPQNSQLWYKTVNDWVDQWTKSQGTNK
jgi:dipeptidyl aminopeptidase/acylaminoacyl peptidase